MTAPQDPFSTPAEGTPAGAAPGQGPSPSGTGPPGYGAPGYGAPPYGTPAYGAQGAPRNGLGVAALVLGILALLTGFFVLGGLLGLVAIVLGVVGRGRAKRGEATNGGMALAGIILGTLGLLLTIAVFAIGASFLSSDSGQRLQDCLREAGGDAAAQQQCQRQFQEDVTG